MAIYELEERVFFDGVGIADITDAVQEAESDNIDINDETDQTNDTFWLMRKQIPSFKLLLMAQAQLM